MKKILIIVIPILFGVFFVNCTSNTEKVETGGNTETKETGRDPDGKADAPNVPVRKETKATVKMNDGSLTLRDAPDVKTGKAIVKIPNGAEVMVGGCQEKTVRIGGRDGRWCQTTYRGQSGWAFDAWLAAADTSAGKAKTEFEGTSGPTVKKNNPKAAPVLQVVRHARQDSYDRVVFEFNGSEMPAYEIRYIDEPLYPCSANSGAGFTLKGDGQLEVKFPLAEIKVELTVPGPDPNYVFPGENINLKTLKEYEISCFHQGSGPVNNFVAYVLGVSSRVKYRVTELKDPIRLAVDLAH